MILQISQMRVLVTCCTSLSLSFLVYKEAEIAFILLSDVLCAPFSRWKLFQLCVMPVTTGYVHGQTGLSQHLTPSPLGHYILALYNLSMLLYYGPKSLDWIRNSTLAAGSQHNESKWREKKGWPFAGCVFVYICMYGFVDMGRSGVCCHSI